MKVHNKSSLENIRKALRTVMTPAEKLLWEELRDNKLDGLKFKRQHSIGNYIVDFYCYKTRLIIELDGSVHHEKEQRKKDELRDENLREMNYTILRFRNEEIQKNLPLVLKKIKNHSENK